jgi:hypothetical protein
MVLVARTTARLLSSAVEGDLETMLVAEPLAVVGRADIELCPRDGALPDGTAAADRALSIFPAPHPARFERFIADVRPKGKKWPGL